MNAIEVEDLSKMYRLGAISTGSLAHDINRWWYKLRGLEDPYTRIAQSNARDEKGDSEYVWSLKNVSFTVKQGEAVGIIGRNGAGKSTLLKIISKVTGPTTGKIRMRGRVASLLEVGTGFHPELTGRENIYLNGAILGMSKREITRKLEEIIDFSGVTRYVDTPVKRYSSGMYVRLAFAVAAHLEPEILIVDEVLAVGDADFQKKCLGKMKDVSDKEGRTVLFVSHNLSAVQSLCTSSILLSRGQVEKTGKTKDVISAYLNEYTGNIVNKPIPHNAERTGNGLVRFEEIRLFDKTGNQIDYVLCGQDFQFALYFSTTQNTPLRSLHFSINLKDSENRSIAHLSNSVGNGNEFNNIHFPATGRIICSVDKLSLQPGEYLIELHCSSFREVLDWVIVAGKLIVEAGDYYGTGQLPPHGLFLMNNKWSCELFK